MINRVTQQTVQRSTLANVQLNLSKMSDLQAQMSSGKTMTRASDDPTSAGRLLSLKSQQAAANQALRNAQDGESWLAQIDSTLQESVDALQRARDLTVQGASSATLNTTSREALATELEGLRDTLLDLANTTINGRSIFAGTSSADVAFEDSTGAYAWNGVAGAEVTRRIGENATVQVDAEGASAYGNGATSVFQLLDDIAADLRSGVEVTTRLDEIDDAMNNMLTTLSDVGIRYKQVTDAQSSLELTIQNLGSSVSDIEDIDLAEAVLELSMQEVAYEGALGAAAKVLQPTLMDYLR
ncbi:flagellar hook-associated protein FlgL [Demequina sp. NBRC 110054]|uniref:flagellar hook-associated protein FlgL n=1 Tax=Demequina sp. NBRC 110054 TaxID=1570343 RepID=UPI0009FEA273|nr:flagellar hook-associated protein FlgL [Demequina sp. NBRC 110054]